MRSESSHNIKKRDLPNDVFITPLGLSKRAIELVGTSDGLWLDPFKATGSYYNQFPTDNKVYTEITEGIDFFDFKQNVDVICSNPPYSLMDKVLQHSINLNPKIINYLIGIGNLTAKRIELMNTNGYFITKMEMCKVWKWYGMSIIVQFEKGKENIISINRTVWK
tara:strand:+ start:407 stop:901 length:495 start_codon:yes stop_codon:yes gene_type:complete